MESTTRALAEASVLIHQPDNLMDGWAPCDSGWCAFIDHASLSMINRQQPFMFAGGGSGASIILSPRHTKIKCGYPSDAGTQGSGGCDGGCEIGPRQDPSTYRWGCYFSGDNMGGMLTYQQGSGYNEVIVSKAYWLAHLPEIVEAIAYTDEAGYNDASRLHSAYLAHYGRTAAQTPLLSFTDDGVFRAQQGGYRLPPGVG